MYLFLLYLLCLYSNSAQITKPHLAYALIGGFSSVFSLVSYFVKEQLYVGEASVAVIFGVIIGPHCLNWFSPTTWGNTDNITLEVSRIILIVDIFAVGLQLPKKYVLRHWFSLLMVLIPVMTFSWLISSVFIWKLSPNLSWVEGLVVAACVTATDPVLASAIVGKGRFTKEHVPGHLRNLLSAESACNDGMALPFVSLALLCILNKGQPGKIAYRWIVETVLYECLFGCFLGAVIGYVARRFAKFSKERRLIDQESLLGFYFVVALFCTGVGSVLGVDDLLVAFAAGASFAWDGWFSKQTEESHVSDVIDLFLNLSYFVYFGAIVPWDQFNSAALGISVWKLVIMAILIILFRRIPILLILKPVIPEVKSWTEALFSGHFGPIGVAAVYMSIYSRAQLEHNMPTPLSQLPSPDHPNYHLIVTIWPIVTFLIVTSIIVHGSSITVFMLGKRINNLTITLTATTRESEPGWLSRFNDSRDRSQRISNLQSSTELSTESEIYASSTCERSKKRGRRSSTQPEVITLDLDPNRNITSKTAKDEVELSVKNKVLGNESRFAIIGVGPNGKDVKLKIRPSELTPKLREKLGVYTIEDEGQRYDHADDDDGDDQSGIEAYQFGETLVIEDSHGEVLQTIVSNKSSNSNPHHVRHRPLRFQNISEKQDRDCEPKFTRPHSHSCRCHNPRVVIAYQVNDDVLVEDEQGEVIQRYHIDSQDENNGVKTVTESSGRSQAELKHKLIRERIRQLISEDPYIKSLSGSDSGSGNEQ